MNKHETSEAYRCGWIDGRYGELGCFTEHLRLAEWERPTERLDYYRGHRAGRELRQSSVAIFCKPPRSGSTEASRERMTGEEVARFALQLREARRTRAQIAGEAAALANSGNDEPLGEVP
jgi:hypothetical protein